MPGVYRYSIDQLGMIINNIIKHRIPMVALFPSTPNNKKDNFGTEAFNEDKLRSGIVNALEKRPVELDQVDHQISLIKSRLRENGERELKSSYVGELVMEALKNLDHVAYVRFASVYRSFEDVRSFLDEVQRLEDELPGVDSGGQLELIKRER